MHLEAEEADAQRFIDGLDRGIGSDLTTAELIELARKWGCSDAFCSLLAEEEYDGSSIVGLELEELLRAGAKKPQAKRFLFKLQEYLGSIGPSSPAATPPKPDQKKQSSTAVEQAGAEPPAAAWNGTSIMSWAKSSLLEFMRDATPKQAQVYRFLAYEPASDIASPIHGLYDDVKNPLVSIEEAVAPLADALSFDFAEELSKLFLKAKCPDYAKAIAAVPALTMDMAIAMTLYTADVPVYKKLNEVLRAEDRPYVLKTWFPYLRLLMEGYKLLEAARSHDGSKMVSRGVPLDLRKLEPDK